MVFSRRNDPRERARTTRLIYLMRLRARTCYLTTRNARCVTAGASIMAVRSSSTRPKGGLLFLAWSFVPRNLKVVAAGVAAAWLIVLAGALATSVHST